MSQDKPVLTPVGKYIELYREHCGTNPQLSNQECEVIKRLAEWSALDRQGWWCRDCDYPLSCSEKQQCLKSPHASAQTGEPFPTEGTIIKATGGPFVLRKINEPPQVADSARIGYSQTGDDLKAGTIAPQADLKGMRFNTPASGSPDVMGRMSGDIGLLMALSERIACVGVRTQEWLAMQKERDEVLSKIGDALRSAIEGKGE